MARIPAEQATLITLSPPSRLIEEAAVAQGRQTFSHSRLSTLDDCPRRYQFRYVDRLKEAFQTIEAFMGTMVHEALQWAYLEREASREPALDAVLERYHAAWREKLGADVKVVREGRRAEEWLAEGEEMLRRHVATTFAQDRLETLAIEPRVNLVLGEHAYTGFIDRLGRDSHGVLHVIDYKTGRSVPRSMKEAGFQVQGYGVAVLEDHGGLEVALRYEYLRPGTALEEVFPRSRCAEVAADITTRIEAALEAESAGDFPARPSPLCRWCGFRETCDASPFRVLATGDEAGTPAATMRAVATVSAGGDCPLCGSALKRRSGSRGDLVACSRYPECRHAVEAR